MHGETWASDWFARALGGFLGEQDTVRLAVWALQTRHSTLSRVLVDLHGPLPPISNRALVVCAASCGDWDAVAALQKRCKPTSQRQRKRQPMMQLRDVVHAIDEATGGGVVMSRSLQAAMRLQRCHPVQFPSDVLYSAARRGRLDEVVWLVDIVEFDVQQALEAAARGGHALVVQWLLDNEEHQIGNRENTDSFQVTRPKLQCTIRLEDAMLADMGVITWREEPRNLASCFMEGRKLLPQHRELRAVQGYPLMNYAACQGDLALLQRLSTHPVAKTSLSSSGVVQAASQGHLNVLCWLWDHDEDLVAASLARVMAEAARRGDMEMLDWMLARRAAWDRAGSLTAVFDAACTGGHLVAVQWAFQHCLDERIRPRHLLLHAANSGHGDIVQYLREEQGYSIMGSTVAQAVMNGHLEVAIWLYERCWSTIGIEERQMLVAMAVKSGHLAVLKWLVEDLGLWSDQAIENAAWVIGDEGVNVLDYLWDRDQAQLCLSLSRVSIARLLTSGRIAVVEWILRHIQESTTTPIAPADAMLSAAFLRPRIQEANDSPRKYPPPFRVEAVVSEREMTNIVASMLQYRPQLCCVIKRLPVWAARRGRLETLKQLEVIGHPHLFSDRVLDVLLERTRDASILLWFLQRRSLSAKQSKQVVRWAAQYCAVPVLQFILDIPASTDLERFQYLRISAWDGARCGHLEVIQFVQDRIARFPSNDVQETEKIWTGIKRIGIA